MNSHPAKWAIKFCLAWCAGLVAMGAAAQDFKDVPPSVPPAFDESTLQRMRAQEKLSSAASAIRWQIEASWDEQLGGAGGYNSIDLIEDAVVLRWKGKLPADVAQAVKRAGRIVPVRVEQAKYSRIELKAAARRLGDFIERESKNGEIYHGVWIVENEKIRVDVTPGSELLSARAALPEVSVPVEVTQNERTQLTSRLDDSPQWWGGARFQSSRNGLPRGGECTTGFGVTNGYSEFILTAAHCGTYPDTVRDPRGEYIGYMGTEHWLHDVILIQNTDAGARIYDGGVGSGEFSKPVAGWDWVNSVDHLCHSGSVSGVVCGFRPYAWAERTHGCDSDGDCYWIEDLIAANLPGGARAALPGDSGGPVFVPLADGRVMAKGTVTGTLGSNQLVFQDFGTAWRDFGVWPLTSY